MYRESLRLAERSYVNSKEVSAPGISQGVKEFFVGNENPKPQAPNPPDQNSEEKSATTKKDNSEQKQPAAPKKKDQRNR
jgi:hypothetical protein